MIRFEPNRKTLNYLALFTLILFNGILAGIFMYIGKQVINNTQKSQVLSVSPEVQKEMAVPKK